jgi:hypothetical protein
MKHLLGVLLCVLALPSLAMAQTLPRIKATVVAFDGKALTLDDGSGKPMVVGLTPTTRIVRQEKRALADIKTGDYVGATLTVARDGSRHAQEVHEFPESLRGSGEGLVGMANNRFMIGGTVSAIAPGSLTLDYRGSEGEDGPACSGRAAKAGGCRGSSAIAVAAGVPVIALLDGDKSLLVPGAILAVSILAGPDGKPVTPGVTVEGNAPQKPAAPAPR